MNTLRMLTIAGGQWLRLRRRAPVEDAHSAQRGQVLAIFAVMSVVLLGAAALVTDVTWWWTAEQQMQRAADAAALAGAVYLPDNESQAFSSAVAEAAKNNYVHNPPTLVVTPRRDPANTRKLIVDIDGGVDTNFARVFGLQRVDVGVTGSAEFVLPVPMGSPENYYGVFGTLRGATFTQLVPQTNVTNSNPDPDSGWRVATTAPAGEPWSRSNTSYTVDTAVNSNNNVYAYTTTNGAVQEWGAFGIVTDSGGAIPVPEDNQVFTITGLEVRLTDAFLSGWCANSRIRAQLSWDGGTSWTAPYAQIGSNLTTTSSTDYTLGSASSLAAWPKTGQPWVRDDFHDDLFRIRLTAVKGCTTSTRQIRLDMLEVRVTYNVETTTTTMVEQTTTTNDLLKGPGTPCANGAPGCYDPDGANLNARGFWATMNTRGASNVNGDAHQPYYDTAGGTVAPVCSVVGDSRACHDPTQYYNYAVEMPPNSTGGYVYVFDPGFCATSSDKGTGDRWFGSKTAVSSWYELRGTNNTPYVMTDDPLIASTGSLFTNMDTADSTMGGSGGAECKKGATAYGDGRDYHLSWYLLNPDHPLTGGPKGTVYRIHTTGTDPAGSLMSTTDGEQSFALYATATGGSPRIYGLGAMQMFTPLCAGGYSGCPVSSTTTSSEFYLAQIEDVHAGKTVEIQLWDPGDTCSNPGSNCLAANLQILLPNAGGWAATPLDYTAEVGTSNNGVNTACNTNTGTGVSSITTSVSSSSLGRFNGCWLTIRIPVDPNYTAPQDGWWKIRYNMTGTGTSNDVTTWRVALLGNPVHLVME